jgi:hypothetical protein
VELPAKEMNITQVKNYCLAPETKQSLMALDFDFDGLVIKISNSISRQRL